MNTSAATAGRRGRLRSGGRRAQGGIGMIEVMIAVLVVSIGFLGMAALQATALATNNSAMQRSMATVASYSILDGMRADLNEAIAGDYNQTVVGNACGNATGGTLVKTQMDAWCQQLAARLGAVASTQGTVACTALTTDTTRTAACTVTVHYDDSRSGRSSGPGITTQAVL